MSLFLMLFELPPQAARQPRTLLKKAWQNHSLRRLKTTPQRGGVLNPSYAIKKL